MNRYYDEIGKFQLKSQSILLIAFIHQPVSPQVPQTNLLWPIIDDSDLSEVISDTNLRRRFTRSVTIKSANQATSFKYVKVTRITDSFKFDHSDLLAISAISPSV